MSRLTGLAALVVAFVALVVVYGVVDDLGLLTPPAYSSPAHQPPASRYAASDIPASYLRLYQRSARRCRGLSWTVLAAVGKVESDHGRSRAPGVRQGVNAAGCCAGPMQFNVRNGPPSTWAIWRRDYDHNGRASVYDPGDAIPAAAGKLCADGLAFPSHVRHDPCPGVAGSAALHQALLRYNQACWYVAHVQQLAGRYQAPTVGGRR